MKVISNLFLLFFLFVSILSCSNFSHTDKQYLSAGNWNHQTREKLLEIINYGKDQNLPVVFDFDNTIICRDIGEATLEVLTQTELHSSFDIIKHYENLLDATKHQKLDSSPYANAYAWAVQVMQGLSPLKVIQATEQAYNNESALKDHLDLKSDTKVKHFRRPYFYPEMIDLIGAFIENKYDVYIVSASNIWSVRWMASKLNQKLKKSGFQGAIDLKNVIGVSTLLKDEKNILFKDMPLATDNLKYKNLNEDQLKKYTLTDQINYPLTGYYGKVANILKWIGKRPYFIAGDSPNDYPMLKFSKYKLWIARLEKLDYQKKTIQIIKNDKSWMIQPTLYKKSSGFVSDKTDLNRRFNGLVSKEITDSWSILKL